MQLFGEQGIVMDKKFSAIRDVLIIPMKCHVVIVICFTILSGGEMCDGKMGVGEMMMEWGRGDG
jgi:hypothetical protein